MHAGFMTRILIVPISLGWAAMLWQLWMTRTQISHTIPVLAQLSREQSVAWKRKNLFYE
jgi:hypothetical protein